MLVKELTLELENCEVITIPGKWIGDICAKNFERELARQASNWIDMEEYCGHFEVEIHKNADEKYSRWGDEFPSKFERLTKYKDITHIGIELYDQYAEEGETPETKTYHWALDYNTNSDALGEDNLNQQSYISELGHLYIVVDEKCAENPEYIFEIFDKKSINDKEDVEWRFDFWDIEESKELNELVKETLEENKKEEKEEKEENNSQEKETMQALGLEYETESSTFPAETIKKNKSSIVEIHSEYKGYEYAVLFQPKGHRCGYVKVPNTHKYYNKDYDDIDILCHGDLTYSRNYLINIDESEQNWWIGFDCAHAWDAEDIEAYEQYYGETYNDYGFPPSGEVRTMEYCINECKSIIDQLICAENDVEE